MADKTDTIKTRLQFDGEKEYKENCAKISQNLKVLSSELKVATAQYASNGNSVEALRAKQDVLKKTFEQQKAKVAETEKALRAMVDAQGENSAGAKRMETALNNAKAAMYNTENQIKSIDDQLEKAGKQSKEFGKQIESAGKVSSNFGDKLKTGLGGIGKTVGTLATATATALAAVGAATISAAKAGISYNSQMEQYTASFQTMLGSQEAAAKKVEELKKFAADTPFEMSDLADATKTMLGFGISSDKASEYLKYLGDISQGDSGKLKSLTLAFSQVSSNGKLMGQDMLQMVDAGFNPLNEISKMTGKSMSQLKDEMAKGAISSDMVADAFKHATSEGGLFYGAMEKQSKTFDGQMSTLKDNAMSMLGDMTKGLQNIAKDTVLPTVNGYIQKLSDAFNSGGFEGLSGAIGSVLGDAISKISIGIEKFIPVATKIISELIGALVQAIPTVLPALTNGIIQIVNGIITVLQQNGPALITAAVTAVVTLVGGLIQALPQLVDAAIQMILALVDALTQQIPTLIPVAINAVITIANSLIDHLPELVQAAIQLVMALIQGLMKALPQLYDEIPKIIMGIVQALVDSLPMIIDAAPKIIVSIITGLINALPQIIMYAPKIIIALISGLIQAIPQLLTMGPQIFKGLLDGFRQVNWGELGGNIIRGILDGFGQIGNWIWNAVKNVGNSIVNGFKNFFGIHSPSKLMSDEVGINIGEGVSEGIQRTDFMATIPNMVNRAKGKINTALRGEFNISASGSQGSTSLQFMIPVYLNGQLQETKVIGVTAEQLAKAQSGQMVALGV